MNHGNIDTQVKIAIACTVLCYIIICKKTKGVMKFLSGEKIVL